MSENRLVSWPWSRRSGTVNSAARPLGELQTHMDSLFDQLWAGFDAPGFQIGLPDVAAAGLNPSTDLKETDEKISVEMELPGLDERDIAVELVGDRLVIKGEKKASKEEGDKDKGYQHVERSYGSFQRSFALPPYADAQKATAAFEKGVLTVSIPKNPEAPEAVKRIEIAPG